jgi:hypothetical protein
MSIPAYEIRVRSEPVIASIVRPTLPQPPGNPANKYRIPSEIPRGVASGVILLVIGAERPDDAGEILCLAEIAAPGVNLRGDAMNSFRCKQYSAGSTALPITGIDFDGWRVCRSGRDSQGVDIRGSPCSPLMNAFPAFFR